MCIMALKNVRDYNQFHDLACEVYHEDSDGLYRTHLYKTERPYEYLLDLLHDTYFRLRFQTNIFPSEYPTAIYVDIDDETD